MKEIKKILKSSLGLGLIFIGLASLINLSAGDFADRPGPRDDRIEAYERRRAAEEEARRRAQAEAEARERERIRLENRQALFDMVDRMEKEKADLETEIDRRLRELDADWIKRFESIQSEIFQQDFLDSLKLELEDYVKELATGVELTERISDGAKLLERDWALIDAHPHSSFSLGPTVFINFENHYSPLTENQMAQYESDVRKVHQQALLERVVSKSSDLNQKWSLSLANIVRLARQDSQVRGLMESLKTTARQVIQNRRQDLTL